MNEKYGRDSEMESEKKRKSPEYHSILLSMYLQSSLSRSVVFIFTHIPRSIRFQCIRGARRCIPVSSVSMCINSICERREPPPLSFHLFFQIPIPTKKSTNYMQLNPASFLDAIYHTHHCNCIICLEYFSPTHKMCKNTRNLYKIRNNLDCVGCD